MKKLHMTGLFADLSCKIKNGSFTYIHPNGMLQSRGKYLENYKDGLWISYYDNGMMRDSIVFNNGKQVGTSLSWYKNGYLKDSTILNEDSSGVSVTWFDNGLLSSVGRYSADMKQNGKWKYYHKNGFLSSIEMYDHGRLINKEYFNEDGEQMNDTTSRDRDAKFVGGEDALFTYLAKKMYFPAGYATKESVKASVIADIIIDESGEVEEIYIAVPLHEAFDNVVREVLAGCPKWLPAIRHNRYIREKFTLPFNFLVK